MSKDTKRKIAEQLSELLKTKNIEDITVKQLVEACGISRQTFYYYYENILNVVEYSAELAVEQGIQESLTAGDTRTAVRAFLTHVVKNKAAICRLMESSYRAECEHIFRQGIHTYLTKLFVKKFPNPQLPPSDIHAFLSFYTYGLIGLILECSTNSEFDIDLLVDQICRLLTGEIKSKLDRP